MNWHILNGEALKSRVENGYLGEIITFNECLIEGPNSIETLENFFSLRENYLKDTYPEVGLDYSMLKSSLFKLMEADDADTIYLWFEEDVFCQTNFWFVCYLLHHFKTKAGVYWVKPPSDAAYGFGSLSHQELELCFTDSKPISVEEIGKLFPSFSRKNLKTLQNDTQNLNEISSFILPAVNALIESVPSNGSLGRPKETLKKLLKEYGSTDFGKIFMAFQKQEAIYGYGDLQVKRMFDEVSSSN
jgi:hypothetical protein